MACPPFPRPRRVDPSSCQGQRAGGQRRRHEGRGGAVGWPMETWNRTMTLSFPPERRAAASAVRRRRGRPSDPCAAPPPPASTCRDKLHWSQSGPPPPSRQAAGAGAASSCGKAGLSRGRPRRSLPSRRPHPTLLLRTARGGLLRHGPVLFPRPRLRSPCTLAPTGQWWRSPGQEGRPFHLGSLLSIHRSPGSGKAGARPLPLLCKGRVPHPS